MKKKAQIIIGLGYGDEGKGLVTDYTCKNANKPIVVRFNGGQQAGHTVYKKKRIKHIFSNFGAGTLRGIPTFWSKYCTFSPGFFLDEFKLLPVTPTIYLDYSCPVTTHYDVLYNRIIEMFQGKNKHGSCGLGFGATIERHQSCKIKFTALDLSNKTICIKKLIAIRNYYEKKIIKETNYLFSAFDHKKEDIKFLKDIDRLKALRSKKAIHFTTEKKIFNIKKWDTYIFEGAQGVLLDKTYGHKPYVTKSNTTSRNAIALLRKNCDRNKLDVEIIYVTRVYHTRHGQGPFKQCKIPLKLKNSKSETNQNNQFQGKFRISHLNIDMLNYSIKCDNRYSKNITKHLVITCLDQLNLSDLKIYQANKLKKVSYTRIAELLNCRFKSVRYSFSKYSENLKF